MTIPVLKMYIRRLPTKLIICRDFKKFDNEGFVNTLQSVLFHLHADYNIHDPNISFQICKKMLDHHGPRKKKYILANHKPFVNKRLSKTIMQRTHFKNKFIKNLTDENRYIYTKQRNLCASILRK